MVPEWHEGHGPPGATLDEPVMRSAVMRAHDTTPGRIFSASSFGTRRAAGLSRTRPSLSVDDDEADGRVVFEGAFDVSRDPGGGLQAGVEECR